MNKKSSVDKAEEVKKEETPKGTEPTNLQEEQPNNPTEETPTDNLAAEKDELQTKYDELNDTYLRLRAEFDNYRKRTLREKSDLIKYGSEKSLTNLLPIIDDFERALTTVEKAEDMNAVKEGVNLIFDKFQKYLKQEGVEAIETVGKPFDTESSEAVAMIPAPEEAQKGAVLDCVLTGYKLFDKVIRHAKVVVGN